MSYTTMYSVPREGPIEFLDEVHNAHRGAMAIWGIIGMRYADFRDPSDVLLDKDAQDRLWACGGRDDLDQNHQFVLMTTFDGALLRRANIPTALDAMRAFEADFPGQTSLPEQAEILKGVNERSSCYAVAWTQTSVVSMWDMWDECEHCEDGGTSRPFDLSIDMGKSVCGVDSAWFLFPPRDTIEEGSHAEE